MGAASRRKGADGERELVRLLNERLGEGVSRNLQQASDGGYDLIGVGDFAIEVKRAEQPRLEEWWHQASVQAAEANMVPALAWRKSRQRWQIIVPLHAVLYRDVLANGWDYRRVALCIDGFAELCRLSSND